MGHLLSRLLHRGRDDRRPPGAQGRLAAGARSPTGSSATTGTTTAPCSCRTPSTSSPSFGQPRPEPTKKATGEPFDYGTPDGYEFFLELGPLANADTKYFKDDVPFWNEMMKHANYDEFWKARNLRPHLKNIKPAVMTVGGWFDAENLYGALETYKSVEATSPGATNMLVMGPWLHGGWAGGDGASLGPVPFDSKTAEFFREQIEFPFFEYYLKGKGTPNFPEAWVFETGTNQWRKYDAWPPRKTQPRSLYLHAAGRLGFDAARARPTSDGFDEYVSDPAKPVPYIDQIADRHDRRVHDRGPAVRLAPARRAGLPDRARWSRT